jgi:hypothetical protein
MATLQLWKLGPDLPKGMPLLSYVLGGSAFGLATRFWQLGIQKRNLFDSACRFLKSIHKS